MKLVRKFNDYYDGALSLYFDNEGPIYFRNGGTIPFLFNEMDHMCPQFQFPYWRKTTNALTLPTATIILAGKAYPIVRCYKKDKEPDAKGNGWFPSSDVVELVCGSSNIANRLPVKSSFHKMDLEAYEMIENFNFDDLHRYVGLPLFVVEFSNRDANEFKINTAPKLKDDYNFQKILDPYVVAQKIHMYLCNEMASDTKVKVPVGSDEIIARSKGFDEWSFRKPPQKKK